MKTLLVVTLLLSAVGCSHVKTATTLTPANPDPNQGVWVFIDSDNSSLTGVYRCKEADAKPSCVKAAW